MSGRLRKFSPSSHNRSKHRRWVCHASECKLVSRNLNQFQSFASLKESLGKMLVQNAIIDGEV